MDVRMPDGTIITGVPDNITQTELLARYDKFSTAETPAPQTTPTQNGILADATKREASKEDAMKGFGTGLADLAKMVGASVVGGTAAIPSGAEQGIKGLARQSMEGQPSSIMPTTAYQPGLDTEETLFGPETEQQRAQRQLNAQRAVAAMPSIPGAKALADVGKKAQKSIEETVSPKTKKAIEESQVSGNIFKGEMEFGTNPSVRGYAMQAASVFGSIAPVVVSAIATKNPYVGGGVGGAMAADEAATNAAEFINKLTDEQLSQQSPFYAQMVAGGADPKEARALTVKKAAETGAALQGIVAMGGDTFTGKLVTGALENMLTKVAGKSTMGKVAAATGIGGLEQGLGETAEGVASDIGTASVVPTKEIGEGSAQNLIMGVLGGAGASAPGGFAKQGAKKETEEETGRTPYTREEQPDAEALARSKGFLTPEGTKTTKDLVEETIPTSESQDYEAMLAELEAQLEGKPTPKAEEPVVAEEPKVEEPVAAEPEKTHEELVTQLETEMTKPAEVAAEPVAEPAAEVKAEAPKADLITEAQKYDTPELRLAQADAFGTDVTTALYNETESHGRAAVRNRGLTEGYANKKDALADAADAAIVAFGTNDYSVFEPFAQTFPKLAKQLKAHLTPAKPAAKPAAAPAATNLQIAEKDLKGNFEGVFSASDYSNPEDGWFNPDTNTLHMKGVDGTNVLHYAGDKTATGLGNITPITNAEEARAAVDAGKSFATVEEGSAAVKEAAPAEAPAAKGAKAAKPKTNLDKVAHLRKQSWEKNPLMAFLADKGLYYKKGDKDNMMSEFNGGKPKMLSGYGPMFKSSGLRIDALLPLAVQDGFLPQDATESDLYSLIQQAFSGKKIEALYQEQGQEDLAKKYEEGMPEESPYEERSTQADAEWYGMSEEDYVNMMAQEVAQTSDADFAELEAVIGDLVNTPSSNISERAAMELLGFTEEEIQNEERRTAAKAGEAATREETTGNEPGEAAPSLELQAQTEQELKDKQAEVDRLTKENERLTKQAEAKAKADAQRDEFVLTGSDRAADVAAAQGQQDIFGAAEEAPAAEKPKSNAVVTFTHGTDTEPGQGSRSGHYPGTYAYEDGAYVWPVLKTEKQNKFTGSLKESEIYTMTDSEALKREASEAGFPYRQASGFPETQYLKSLGYKAMRRGPEIIVFDAKDANFKKVKPEVASEVVPAAEKPAAPQLTREPVTIEGETKLVAEKVQHSMIKDQVKKLHAAQVKALENFYGFKSDSAEFLDAVRQDIIDFVNKGSKYINGKIRTIIRSMANGVLSVAIVFNPQFVSQPYTIAVPQYTTKVEQVMASVPEAAQKDMSEGAKRAYAVIYPAIKGEITKNDKFFIVADKKSANTFVFNPDGSLFMYSKTLFSAGIGDFLKGDNNVVANRITPAGLFDLGLRDAKRSANEAATAGEYDFGKVFVLDKSQMGQNGPYSTTIMHSVWTHEKDAKQRLAALQKPGAEDSRYSFGCINVDKNTYGQLVTNNLAQMDGAKIFIVPENATDVMDFVNGEATYSKDIIRQRVEPVTKETKVEVERAAETPAAERTVVAKEEEGPVYNSIEPFTISAEEKKRSPSFKRRMDKLNRDRLAGKITDEAFINEADWALKQAENERMSKETPERVRGADFIRQKLLEAKRKGQLSDEAVNLAEWFIQNNEQLVDDLGVSIRSSKADGVGGQYTKLSRIMYLVKEGGSNLTVVHEILHHLERMMPANVQQAIRTAWAKQLVNAQKRAKKPAEQLYFKLLMNSHYGENNFDFIDVPDGEMSKVFMQAMAELRFNNPGSTSSIQLAETLLKMGLVPISNYQFFNPSEFWAVNGSEIVKGRFDAVKGGVLSRLKNWLKELGQKIKSLFGLDSTASIIRALDSLAKADGTFVTDEMLGEGEYKNIRRNFEGGAAPAASWESPEESKMDTFIYKLQDKLIDTKRIIENIKKTSGEIADNWNAYLKEELYHGRSAKRTQDFLNREMLPILEEMKEKGVSLAQFEEYLHMRHAEERNELVAKRNPKLQDQGSGVKTADAVEYLANLSPEQNKTFASLASKFDKIIDNTQKLLVSSGLETQETIDSWNQAYEHYVPLMRDDLDFKHHGSGLGAGYSTKGSTSKSAVGSTKKVIDIFANVALQRERAIVRSEKARVGRALYGLAIKNPNPGFWLPINPEAIKDPEKLTQELIDLGLSPEDAANIIQEPKVPAIDKKTGLVKYQVNPLMRNSDNVFPIRINGEDRYIFFNTSDPRAVRMVEAMKNLDAEQLGVALGTVAEVTRWIASVNTQFNPVFGAWNFVRDVQGAAFNLTTTEIAGNEKEVLKNVFPALRGIYVDLRENRKKKAGESEWAKLFEQYQNAGGQTGYRDQFNKAKEKANIVQRELSKLDRGNVSKAAHAVFNWLSDYNDAMENAVRLSAFKVALDQGLSEERAASIAKNLTVNFNRKGAASPTLQALYAFFNAAVQGTARLAQTLKGPAGKKIMAGGIAIGVFQALALAMAGFDDDDPPEFLKNKNLILPVPGGNYLIVPMPLGFNIFPGIGRLTTEYVLGQAGMITGAKSAGSKVASVASLVMDAFNPLGSGGVLQMLAPTVVDPWAAISMNRDAFGRPISKEDRATAPTPGYTRSRENASAFSKALAEFLNYVSSPIGTKYTKGVISPTADQIDYLIGQYTGGTGREVMKAAEFGAAVVKGETGDLPSYRVPVVGKLYGETESPAAISAKFYENVTKLAEHENEIKMRRKNKDDVQEYKAENPEVRFIHRVNNLENQITQINKQKKALQEKNAPEERIKRLDERKTKMMKEFNDKVKNLERQ